MYTTILWEKLSHPFWEISTSGASPECLYINAHKVGKKEELGLWSHWNHRNVVGFFTQQQDYDGWRQTFWKEWQEGWIMLHVREQQRWMELCCGMGGKRAESLCVTTGDKPTQVMLWVSATNCPLRKKGIRSFSDNWKKPRVHSPWSSWGIRIKVISSGVHWLSK